MKCLKKQDEQKPVNKVEPKFKVGDWIVYDDTVCKIYRTSPDDKFYHCFDINDCIHIYNRSLEDKMHLWTIKDAKIGDVLHSVGFYNDCIFIFNGIDKWKFDEPNGDRVIATGYCCLFVSSNKMEFSTQGPDCIEVNTIKPATKEQRDLLFAKMKKSGFKWDKEKKKLKKFEDEPKNYKQQIMSEITDLFKDYIQQKSTSWTEEDEKKRTLLIKILEVNHPHGLFKVNSSETMRTEELISWLKSINYKI